MSKIYLSLLATLLAASAGAQQLAVPTGGSLSIFAGTRLHFNGLTLTPSTPLVLNNQTLRKNTTVVNAFGSPYVSRTYSFSNTQVFSGSIRFGYLDTELGTTNEATLKLGTYQGTAWAAINTATINTTDNYAQVNSLSSLPLKELMLANSFATILPLQSLELAAQRHGAAVTVSWSTLSEVDVNHFDVERSGDGLHWITAVAGVPAANKPHRMDYEQTDRPESSGRLYYRIRQVDRNGRISFSRLVSVAATQEAGSVMVSPNPASGYFTLSGVLPDAVGQVELFSSSGQPVGTWEGHALRFELSRLAAGRYYVRIRMTDGTILNKPLLIQ